MTDIKQLAEVCDLVQTESESQTATLAERVLTPEAQAERDDFQAEYGYDGNCSCHISPPCNSCLHPGNPRNQEEDETAWVADGAIDWTAPEMQYLAPKDYDLPPADPALLASANRILSDRLEGVAHVLRGCGPSFGGPKPRYLNEVCVDREEDEDDGYSVCDAPKTMEKESSEDMAYIAASNPAVVLELIRRLRAAEGAMK